VHSFSRAWLVCLSHLRFVFLVRTALSYRDNNNRHRGISSTGIISICGRWARRLRCMRILLYRLCMTSTRSVFSLPVRHFAACGRSN